MEGAWTRAFEVAREAFPSLDPRDTARARGVRFDAVSGWFELEFLGLPVTATWPAAEVTAAAGRRLGDSGALIVLHFLLGEGGMPATGEWIAYRDLPGARNHAAAYHVEAETPLADRLGEDLTDWREFAERRGFELREYGDLSFVWMALPHIPLLFVLTAADEELPAEARILYDSSAGTWLPSEDLAVLGELASYVLTGHELRSEHRGT